MLAAVYMVGGMFRIVFSLAEQFPSWAWVFVNGVITLLLGVAIWVGWPASGLWVLGLFVGIDLIMNGTTWSVLAVGVRNGPARITDR